MANRRGDLDAYAVHFRNQKEFGGGRLKWLWNCLSKRMRKMLPAACAGMAGALSRAGVHDRLYSKKAREVVSDDLLVCNVGVSSAYQSPAHKDTRDTGWTFAFAVKCNHAGTAAEQGRGKRYRSNSDGDGPAAWETMRRVWDDESYTWEDGMARLQSPIAKGWDRLEAAFYPSRRSQLLCHFFGKEDVGQQRQLRGEHERRVVGLEHFLAHRSPELMRTFLPGVPHFEEVDDLVVALKADLDRVGGNLGRYWMTRHRRHWRLQQDDSMCSMGCLFMGFEVGARGALRGLRELSVAQLEQGLAGGRNLERYVKSMLFFGDDELDCMCCTVGPRSGRAMNLLYELQQILDEHHLRPMVEMWVWEKLRLIYVQDSSSLLGSLPGELRREVAKALLRLCVPRRLRERGAWQELLALDEGERAHGAWEELLRMEERERSTSAAERARGR